MWDTVTGTCRAICPHGDSVVALKWHTSLPIVSTAALDHIVRVWDARSGVMMMINIPDIFSIFHFHEIMFYYAIHGVMFLLLIVKFDSEIHLLLIALIEYFFLFKEILDDIKFIFCVHIDSFELL